jgi:hypothetical protein
MTVVAGVALRPAGSAPVGDPPVVPQVLPTGRPVPGAVSPLRDPGVVGSPMVYHLTLGAVPIPAVSVQYKSGVGAIACSWAIRRRTSTSPSP